MYRRIGVWACGRARILSPFPVVSGISAKSRTRAGDRARPSDRDRQHCLDTSTRPRADTPIHFLTRTPAIIALLLYLAFPAFNGLAEPKGLEAAIERANRTLNQGKLDEAEKQVDAAQKLYPDKPEVWNLRGAIFLKQRRLDDAAEQFSKALQLDPKFYGAKFNLAQVFLLQNKFDDAQTRFQELQTVDPKSELLQFKIVLCTVLKGQADQASTLIDTMTFPGETPAYYYARAAALLKRSQQKEARQYLANARKYYPDAQCAFFDQELKQVGLLTPAAKLSPTPAAKP